MVRYTMFSKKTIWIKVQTAVLCWRWYINRIRIEQKTKGIEKNEFEKFISIRNNYQ